MKNKFLLFTIGLVLVIKLILFYFYDNFSYFPDTYSFNEAAEYLKNGDTTNFFADRTFGYPLIMNLFSNFYSIAMFQVIVSVLVSGLLFETFRALNFKDYLNCIFVILSQTIIQNFIFETAILADYWIYVLHVLLFYLIIKFDLFKNKNLLLELIISFVLGYLVYIKPFFVFYPILLLALYFYKNFSLKEFKTTKLIVIIPSISIYIWTCNFVEKQTGYNQSTSYLGLNLAQNCVYFAENCPNEYAWLGNAYAIERNKRLSITNDNVAMSIWGVWGNGTFNNIAPNFPDATNIMKKYAQETILMNLDEYVYQVITRSWFDFWKTENIFTEEYIFQNNTLNSFLHKLNELQLKLILLLKLLFLLISVKYIYQFFFVKEINYLSIIVLIIWANSILQGLVTYGTNAKYAYPFEIYMFFIVSLEFIKIFNSKFSNKVD